MICERCGFVGSASPLTRSQIEILDDVADGLRCVEIATKRGCGYQHIKNQLQRAYATMGMQAAHSGRGGRSILKIIRYWNCELFQIGLRELGMIR